MHIPINILKYLFKIIFIATVILLFPEGFTLAQKLKYPIKNIDSLSLKQIAYQVDSFLLTELNQVVPQKMISDTALLHMLFANDYSLMNQSDAFIELYESQIKNYRSDPGLRFVTNYQENFKTGVITDEDISYVRRLYLGIEWDLLNSGLFANKSKVKAIEKQRDLALLEQKLQTKQTSYLYLYAYITYLFKREKALLLAHRKQVVDEQLRIAQQMYLLRIASWEQLLELQSKAAELEALINDNKVYFNTKLREGIPEIFMDETFRDAYLPVFDIDPEKMISLFNQSGMHEEAKALQLERYKAEHWRWNDFVVRPFFRYNIMQPTPSHFRNYASVGLAASAPIKFGSSSAKEIDARLQIVENEQDIENFASANELLNHYYEFQFKKMQFTSFYFKKLLIEERLRKEIVMSDFEDEAYSPLRVMQILDEKLAVEIELVDLKKDMYLKLLKIFTYLDTDNPNDFITVFNPEEMGIKYNGYRYIYIWSEQFKKVTNEHIIAYLKNNGISEVLVSAQESDIAKLQDFVFKCNGQHIKVHLLIGHNSLLDKGKEALLELLEKYQQVVLQGIHLDIEPHTLTQYKTNQEASMGAYLDLLNAARQYCDEHQLELSVSIPVFYPEAYLPMIYGLSDKVFVMAYEHPDIAYVEGKLSEEMEISKDKTVIVLSPNDFTDRLMLENFINQIIIKLGINEIAIHDLRRLLENDARSINKVQ